MSGLLSSAPSYATAQRLVEMCFPAAPTTLRAHANLPLTRYFIPLPVSLQNRLGVFANGTVGTNVLPSLEALLGTTPRGFGLEPPPQLPPPSSPASPRVSGGGAVGSSDAATGGTDDASGSETDTDAVPDLHDANAELALRRGALLPLMWHAVQKPSDAMQRSLGASLTEAHSPPSSPLRGFDFDAIARRRPELAGPLREFRDALALRRQHAASPPPTPGAGGVTSTSGQGNVQQMLQQVLQQLSGTGAASTGASNAAVGDAHAAPGAQPQTFQLVQQADGSVQIVLQQSPNAADANAATAAGASSLLARSARSAAATPPLSQPSTSPSPPPVVGDRVTVHAPVQGFSCAATVRYIGAPPSRAASGWDCSSTGPSARTMARSRACATSLARRATASLCAPAASSRSVSRRGPSGTSSDRSTLRGRPAGARRARPRREHPQWRVEGVKWPQRRRQRRQRAPHPAMTPA